MAAANEISPLRRLVRSVKRYWLKNPVRRELIHAAQRRVLDAGGASPERVIVFLVPGIDMVNGGIMSIVSLADETARLSRIHGAQVYVCTVPGEPPLLRFTRFRNERTLLDFRLLLERIAPGTPVLLHIPEIFVASFVKESPGLLPLLAPLEVEYNVLLQNIDSVPARQEVEGLKRLGPVSFTAAHKSYANAYAGGFCGCPMWHLSVWISPEQYDYRPFQAKKDLVVVSPDHHPERDRILALLRSALPDFEFVVVHKLTYQEYKALVASAKFALTFGEGLDGYFVETIFSGGIGCTVYNSRFFTEEYRSLPCLYRNWQELAQQLPADIARLNREEAFTAPHRLQFQRLADDYSYDSYRGNLERFYRERFPRPEAEERSGQSGQSEQSEQSGQGEQGEQSGQSEQSEQSEQSGAAGVRAAVAR